MESETPNSFPEFSEIDIEILKHKEAHFSGSFPEMIAYYETDKPGKDPEFSIQRIQELEALEKLLRKDLSFLALNEENKEEIAESKKFYKRLKNLHQKKGKESSLESLISDLILSQERLPKKEMEKIIREGKKIVPLLIALMQNEELRNPLFPGFGNAPSLAIECLRAIKDDSAIIALFEEIGHEEVIDEEGALLALKEIGEPAKNFLLKVLSSLPITSDNERAAIALIHFKDRNEVAEKAVDLLEKEAFRKSIPLSSYLALIAAGTLEKGIRTRLKRVAEDNGTPGSLKTEIALITKGWQ